MSAGALGLMEVYYCPMWVWNLMFYHSGPTGEIVAAADDKQEASLVAQFDLDKIKSKRHSWGVFRDRRPDLYKVLLSLDGTNPSS